MKTTTLLITLLCSLCILNAHSQTEKGTYMLGGGASTGIDINDGPNVFHIALSPDIGYFFSDDLAIGAYLPLGFTSYEGYRGFNYGITPFFRLCN